MKKTLVIVESPNKAKTIQRFLGNDFLIKSSFGHVRDLPKRELGIDVNKNFEPKYVIPPKAKKVISELKKESSKAENTILATDEDREGEAIAWHLQEALKLKDPERIVFHEITKSAIDEALGSPRKIDINLVNAQQARRILDRIVGYKLSPFLWKKVAKGLSAGRVQSVAVRLIVEKEREIEKFLPIEYWGIEAQFKKDEKEFLAQLYKKDEKNIEKLEIKNQTDANNILENLNNAEYIVESVEKKETKKYPAPPFTTSTLTQTASARLKFPAKVTMFLAQKLYEQGLITYHRTDSLNLSETSLASAKKFISANFGSKYWAEKKYKTKSARAQEAHEAIRPSYADKDPKLLKEIDPKQLKLYTLIWQRFIACQMTPAIFDSVGVDIKANNYTFRTTGQTLQFDGFLRVYPTKFEEIDLPELEKNNKLELQKLNTTQHFTEPPARYSEATLIKALEKNGIGRPSTYAPIISTIQDRKYVNLNDQKKFVPSEIGTIVNDVLVLNFPEVVDVGFTAKMEDELDQVAEGKNSYKQICKNFYDPFSKDLEKKYKNVKKEDLITETDKICPKCGSSIIDRMGRFGRFYACSKFPECKHTESIEDKNKDLGIKCPKCKEGDIVARKTKRGKIFYGCNKFPSCDFALWDKPTNQFCPMCDSILMEKNKKIKCSNKDCSYTNE